VPAGVDFLEEFDRDENREARILEILYVEEDGGPDVAFVRSEPRGEDIAPHRQLHLQRADLGLTT